MYEVYYRFSPYFSWRHPAGFGSIREAESCIHGSKYRWLDDSPTGQVYWEIRHEEPAVVKNGFVGKEELCVETISDNDSSGRGSVD